MTKFRRLPLEFYTEKIRQGEPFSFAGYSDAEWFCILKKELGNTTGLGQILDEHTGILLGNAYLRRRKDPRFMAAVPDCIWTLNPPVFPNRRFANDIELWLSKNKVYPMLFYERDMVLDNRAAQAGLFPLIDALRGKRVAFVGPAPLRALDFLPIVNFVEISTPNFHMERRFKDVARQVAAVEFDVCLLSAGVSAAILIDLLHDQFPDRILMDCGSIWDLFVGIGLQRTWRQEIYKDPARLEAWKRANLTGENCFT